MRPSPAEILTDSAGAWFGATVARTGETSCEVRLPNPDAGTGGTPFARLIQAVDIAAGVSACLAVAPRSALTADIVLNLLAQDLVGDLRAKGSLVRAGRGQAVARVEVIDGRGELVAVATANHGVRDVEIPLYVFELDVGDSFDLSPYRTVPIGRLEDVFYDPTGELPINAYTTNPWGVAQGPLMATLVEPAALHAGLGRVEDVSIRFVAGATVGPVGVDTQVVRNHRNTLLLNAAFIDRGADRLVALATVSGPPVSAATSEGDIS